MSSRPHTVVVVDDQVAFRAAARAVISRMEGFELAGEASNGLEAVDVVRRLRPALVLMDINMPGLNGVSATRQIVAAHPDTVVFLCSTYEVSDLPADAASSGARGYLSKERLSGDVLRQLWRDRDSGVFATL